MTNANTNPKLVEVYHTNVSTIAAHTITFFVPPSEKVVAGCSMCVLITIEFPLDVESSRKYKLMFAPYICSLPCLQSIVMFKNYNSVEEQIPNLLKDFEIAGLETFKKCNEACLIYAFKNDTKFNVMRFNTNGFTTDHYPLELERKKHIQFFTFINTIDDQRLIASFKGNIIGYYSFGNPNERYDKTQKLIEIDMQKINFSHSNKITNILYIFSSEYLVFYTEHSQKKIGILQVNKEDKLKKVENISEILKSMSSTIITGCRFGSNEVAFYDSEKCDIIFLNAYRQFEKPN